MSKILGFDVSSKCIGWGLLNIDDNKNITLIKCGHLEPIKKGSIVERIVSTRDRIKKIIEELEPDYIGIENIIQFMKGKSTAKTIIMLTTFNRMITLLSYDYLNKEPALFSVLTIRHGLKINNIFPKKEDMPALVSQHLGITFPYEFNKKGKLKIENYDMADGIAVALYFAFKLIGKFNVKKHKVKKKNE